MDKPQCARDHIMTTHSLHVLEYCCNALVIVCVVGDLLLCGVIGEYHAVWNLSHSTQQTIAILSDS